MVMEELMLVNPEDSVAKKQKGKSVADYFSKAYSQDGGILNATKDALAHAFR